MTQTPPHRTRDAHASRFEPEGVRSLAKRYWRLMLALACAVIIVALCYAAWQFSDALSALSQRAQPSASAASSTSPLDEAKLNAALDAFSARQARYQSLQAQPSLVADPSE